jgi:hypothetical protein
MPRAILSRAADLTEEALGLTKTVGNSNRKLPAGR